MKIKSKNLKDEYINKNIIDGYSSTFEIFTKPVTKRIKECNYSFDDEEKDPYWIPLSKLVKFLTSIIYDEDIDFEKKQ